MMSLSQQGQSIECLCGHTAYWHSHYGRALDALEICGREARIVQFEDGSERSFSAADELRLVRRGDHA